MVWLLLLAIAGLVVIGYLFREKWLFASPEESERLSAIDDDLRKEEGRWY